VPTTEGSSAFKYVVPGPAGSSANMVCPWRRGPGQSSIVCP
jgi:hypothetical protein